MIDDSLAGADPLSGLVGFAEALRRAGIAAPAHRSTLAAEAVGHWEVAAGADPYWPLRVAFCSSEADLPRFDAVYQSWFRRRPPPEAGADGPVTVRQRVATPADPGAPAGEAGDAERGAGNTARLATRDFGELTEAELAEVSAWVDLLRPVPLRPAMGHRRARRGQLDPAGTMRLMLRNGGELLRLRHRRRVPQPRRLLLLVDVSASMRPYSDVLLRFAHAALRANPRTTEVFTVGTRFTHLTRQLRPHRPEVALRAAGAVAADWSGGTTLGVALREFLRRWGGAAAVRSATVVLCSDGFEFRDPGLMLAQVARLAALARVFIWVDPQRRSEDHRPVDDHVARAQACADAVLGCHNYQALRLLAKEITDA